jgi:LmbE family N-acetylglucosaminyl deacetylase
VSRPAHEYFVGRRPLDLSALDLPPGLRVAVTAPHPDDFDCIAVTMRRLQANGNAIHVAVLTTGVSGVDDGFAGAQSLDAKARIREAEQRASGAQFGLDGARLTFLRLADGADGHVDTAGPNQEAVRRFLLDVRPDVVFLPHGRDSNVTHRRTHEIVTGIVRAEHLSVVACLNEDPKTLEMRRDLVVPFDEADAEWKGSLLRLHASQQARNLRTRGAGLDDRILSMNRATAQSLRANRSYAEMFELACYERGALVG